MQHFSVQGFFSRDNQPPPFLMSPFLSSSSHPQQPRAAATKPTGNPLGYFPSCPAEISRSLPHAPDGVGHTAGPTQPPVHKQLLARLQEPPKLEESGISFPNSAPLARFPYFPPSWAESSPGISTLQPSHHQRSLHTFPDCFFFGRSQSPEASRGLLKLWPQERLSCGIPTEHQPGCRGKQGGVCEV